MGTAISKGTEITTSLQRLNDNTNPSLFQSSKTICESTTTDTPPLPPPPTSESSSSSSSSSPPPPTPESSSSQTEDTISTAASSFTSSIKNPGPYEQATMDSKRLITLDTHDGFRCDINKQLSPYMPVVHSFWLGTSMLPDNRHHTYTFLAQVADEMGLIMARCDPQKRSVDGRIHRAIFGGLAMMKVQLGVSTEGTNDQLIGELDFGGETFTGNLKYGCMGGGIMLGCNYFQAVTERWSVGGEGMYLAANRNLLSSYMVKYTIPSSSRDSKNKNEISTKKGGGDGGTVMSEEDEEEGESSMVANFNTMQGLLTLNYCKVVTPNRVTLGAELQCSPASLESQLSVGAEFNLTRSKVNICIDGSGKMQSVVEAKLGMAPGSPTLNFSAEVDHVNDQMRFGYGLNIGG